MTFFLYYKLKRKINLITHLKKNFFFEKFFYEQKIFSSFVTAKVEG